MLIGREFGELEDNWNCGPYQVRFSCSYAGRFAKQGSGKILVELAD